MNAWALVLFIIGDALLFFGVLHLIRYFCGRS